MTTVMSPESVDRELLDDDETHIWCCDPDVALCGEHLDGDFVPEGSEKDDGECCRLCIYVWDEGLPCPVGRCPGLVGVEL